MILTKVTAAAYAALLAIGIGSPMAVGAVEAGEARVEMILMQEEGRTIAMSVSVAQGPHVETASFISGDAVATGAIASLDTVQHVEASDGFTLFTSTVGPAALN